MTAPALLIFGVFWYGLVLIGRQLAGAYWSGGMQVYALWFLLSVVAVGLLGLLQWAYGSKDRTLRSYFFTGDSIWIKRVTGGSLLLYGVIIWMVWTGRGGPLPPGDMPPGDLTGALRGPDVWVARWKIFLHYTPYVIQWPIAEEFLFRGLLLAFLKPRCNRWIAWGGSCVLFVLSHDIYSGDAAYLLRQGTALLVAGAILLAVTERARSLLPAMVLHALNNLAHVLVEFRRAFPA